jgi:hypothetical protein
MEINSNNMIKALSLVDELSGLQGYPKNPKGVEGFTKSVMVFVQDFDRFEWLISKILGTQEKFPAPVQARNLYTQSPKWAGKGPYAPEDGVEMVDIP